MFVSIPTCTLTERCACRYWARGMAAGWKRSGAQRTSSLYQVLVSIQGLILVDDPMFNEPGFDGIRGTAEGDMKSREHNEEIRLYTVRHAMIAHLKKPRAGVEGF